VSLVLKIADIPSTPVTIQTRLATAWCGERLGPVYRSADTTLPVRVRAVQVAGVIDVEAGVQGRFAFDCSRCAEPAEITVETDFKHHFVAPGHLDAGDGFADFDADPDVSEHDGVHVDLEELCIEYTLLALPNVPVCSENCRGLCPTCGANRNRETCACDTTVDAASPWSALAGVKLESK